MPLIVFVIVAVTFVEMIEFEPDLRIIDGVNIKIGLGKVGGRCQFALYFLDSYAYITQ